METSEDSIQVFIRIKPGQQDSPLLYTETEIKLDKHQFAFDKVFPPQSNQSNVFHAVGTKLLSNTLDGYNSCIFVYGQTGSGKTHTMIGQDNGIMQNSFKELFSRINLLKNAQCLVTCTYFELYNQQIIDLIDHKRQKKLNIRQDAKKGVFVENLAEQTALDTDKLMQVLYTGMKNRHIGQTQMNRESSRSHSIFTISLSCKIQEDGKKVLKTPKLHFVDLAGSQRQKHTMASGDRLKQAGNINKSLTTLGMVINALTSEKPRSHIPYRDSKLTCLLRDSLGGNSKTIIVATISSCSMSFQQTLSTLNFANRAKMVKVKALINQESLSSNIQIYKQEIRRLKTQILKLKTMQHKSPFKINVFKNQAENSNIPNIQYHFEQINKKISVISQQLNQNIMSPSLQALLQNLNKNRSHMTPIAQMCDQSEEASNQKQNLDLIQYLNSNYNLLTSINKKVNQYLQVKQELRSLAFNRKLAIQQIKTPSKGQRDLYEQILKKKQIQISLMQKELDKLMIQIQNKQVQNRQLFRKHQSIKINKGKEQEQIQDTKQNFDNLQKEIDIYKITVQKLTVDKNRLEKHLSQSQSILKQTKQLYFYSQQKYENEKYCKNKLQIKLHQINTKLQNYQKVQKRLLEDIKEDKQSIQKLKLIIEQHEAKQEELLNEIQEFTETIEYNKKLYAQLSTKHNKIINNSNQTTQKLSFAQTALNDIKLIYEKQAFQNKTIIDNLQQKNIQLQRANQKYLFQINIKTQFLQQQKKLALKELQLLKQKNKELVVSLQQREQCNYRIIQESQHIKLSSLNIKKELQHQISLLQIKFQNKQSQFISMQIRNHQLQKQLTDYVSHSKKQLQSYKSQNELLKVNLSSIQSQNRQFKKQLENSKQLINNATKLKIQNQQLQKSYKEVIKENYKLKGKYNCTNQELQKQKNDQLISKVTYYQQKFKLMSMQYQKVTEIVKRLKHKQLQQSKKIQYYEQNNKLNRFDHQQINDQNVLIRQLREQNRDLKNRLQNLQGNTDKHAQNEQNLNTKHKADEKQRLLRNKLEVAVSRWQQFSGKDIKSMSTQQLIDIWEVMQKQSKIKFDNIAKGIRRQQKLKSQNNFILKQNIYLRQKLAGIQKETDQKPRKIVKIQ